MSKELTYEEESNVYYHFTHHVHRSVGTCMENKPISISVPIHEKNTVLDTVADLLNIEPSREVRRELSFLQQREEHYYQITVEDHVVVEMPISNGLMVIGLDGYGSEIYYTRNATGGHEKIDVFEKFKPYQPKRVIVVTNIKGMGPTQIYDFKKLSVT